MRDPLYFLFKKATSLALLLLVALTMIPGGPSSAGSAFSTNCPFDGVFSIPLREGFSSLHWLWWLISADLGDLDGDGMPELVTGSLTFRLRGATARYYHVMAVLDPRTLRPLVELSIPDNVTYVGGMPLPDRPILVRVVEGAGGGLVVSARAFPGSFAGLLEAWTFSLGALAKVASVQVEWGTDLQSVNTLAAADLDGDGTTEVALLDYYHRRWERWPRLRLWRLADGSLKEVALWEPGGLIMGVPAALGVARVGGKRLLAVVTEELTSTHPLAFMDTVARLVAFRGGRLEVISEGRAGWTKYSASAVLADDLDGDGSVEVFVGAGLSSWTAGLLAFRQKGKELELVASKLWSRRSEGLEADHFVTQVAAFAGGRLLAFLDNVNLYAGGLRTWIEAYIRFFSFDGSSLEEVASIPMGEGRVKVSGAYELYRAFDVGGALLLAGQLWRPREVYGEEGGLWGYVAIWPYALQRRPIYDPTRCPVA